MNNKSSAFYEDKSSGAMAVASLVLGILSIITCCCIYSALILGSLAIIFALLSRGGEMKMTSMSTVGMILGIIGIVFGILFIAFLVFSAAMDSGGLIDYYDFLPYDYNSIYENPYYDLF